MKHVSLPFYCGSCLESNRPLNGKGLGCAREPDEVSAAAGDGCPGGCSNCSEEMEAEMRRGEGISLPGDWCTTGASD